MLLNTNPAEAQFDVTITQGAQRRRSTYNTAGARRAYQLVAKVGAALGVSIEIRPHHDQPPLRLVN